MKNLLVAFCLFFAVSGSAEEQKLTAEQEKYLAEATKTWESLNRMQGEIQLPEAVASLNVPESFYYLSPKDAETVLVDMWGNPKGMGSSTLGMLVPAAIPPFYGDAWAVTIEYVEEGYVSDTDADEINYDELLVQMKEETEEASANRVSEGYDSLQLVGWAAKPFYDKEARKLHWAKEIKFGRVEGTTLNYNIRVLGRKGVLVLNFIADMDQKAMIEENIGSVLALAEFNTGARYEDFDADVDQVAAYGLGALVAGKVAMKTGLIAAAILFLKKFGVYILIALGALGSKVYKRKKAKTETPTEDTDAKP
ncbi:DUF2167 domain-containing protein [Rheinheimera sp. MM224]|uniref:DUF2167 domain-containing protein n=1 Tax=Rheinheimera sp. MM224 TaxID=3019969 RepID=UPI0021F8725E|nr:DUF2167 domain-containing protein [Rheinheimera sp. MM224]CAI3791656.1 hypothetical protein JAMGFMIE_00363 [Rheinheimera sp. MM224]